MNAYDLYCLNEGRTNFTTVVGRDDEHLFGYASLKDLLETTIAEAEVMQKPPRIVIFGQNGLGKTLHLRYLEAKIKKNNKPFHVVYLKVGSFETKTRINQLHKRMIDAFGPADFEDRLKRQYKAAGHSWLESLQLPEVVTHAAQQLATSSNPIIVALARRFLGGEHLKAGEADKLSITKTALTEGDDYAAVIRLLAELVRLQDKKSLLFCLDEMEYVAYVNNQDAFTNWKDGLRNLLDIRQVGFIFTVAAQSQDQMVKLLRETDIVRRIAINNYHRLPSYKPTDTLQFFRELFATFINQQKLADLEAAQNLTAIPGYSRETFPFTKDALDGYCRWIHKKDTEAKPSEFEDRLDNTAAAACLQGKQVIDAEFLRSRNEYREED